MTTPLSPITERRRFLRIQFDGTTEVVLEQQTIAVELIDLSLKGALIQSAVPLPDNPETSFTLCINLAQDSTRLVFEAQVARTLEDGYGLSFGKIDLDTMTHLRRLMDLNLVDEKLLERELEQPFPAN